MKRVVIAIVLLVAIITAGALENVYVNKIFDRLDSSLREIENDIESSNGNALEKTSNLISWWESKRKYMELFIYSPDVRSFSVALGETEGSLMCDDFQNALSKIESLRIMSANIRRILDFNLEDII